MISGVSVRAHERKRAAEGSFRHEALLYSGDSGFLETLGPFVRDGVERREPTLVAAARPRIDLIRHHLGDEVDGVHFVDMAVVGKNPARIIPTWRAFLDAHPGRRVRGVGEPLRPGRSAAEVDETQIHEQLLNLAFADDLAWLVCAYDIATLDASLIDEAYRSHPFVSEGSASASSDAYVRPEREALLGVALPPPPPRAVNVPFEAASLAHVRRFVGEQARAAGVDPGRTDELVLAVNEVATNSVRYAGGEGILSLWQAGDELLCEVRDAGVMDDALVGRALAAPDERGGRGLWLANQLCELVQIRTSPAGSTVRMHMPCSASA